MTCDDVRPQLTAYLDGELEDDRGSAVRGHLRGCEPCRTAADTEAALRDGLRALPSPDVPATLWARVQAELAQAEIADAAQARWRRVLARWSPSHWVTPRFAIASGAVAVIVCVWAWRYTHRGLPAPQANLIDTVSHGVMQNPRETPPPPQAANKDDVAAAIAALAADASDEYAAAATELVGLARTERATWPETQQKQFDAKLAELQHAITTADEGRARHRAYRTLIRYLERATTRDEVAFADTRGTP
ncbi:MAG: zf-HC2 domain-containing protein [Kofleriaceae bacterium]